MTKFDSAADTDLRAAARRRLEAKANSWRFLGLWVVLGALFTVLWAITSPGGYFWPVWPILGVGIGVAFSFFESYGRRRITEERIDAEIARIRG